jgi:hypothetical protein
MDVCLLCLLYKDGSMERKSDMKDKKDLKTVQKWIKGEKPRTDKKKSHRGHGCLSLVSVVCCQVEASATSRSLVQRSPTDCGVSLNVIKRNSNLDTETGNRSR